ncbi:bifunctional adenosylcobinamide kinase/adenosylcobinamide-phosphate guanylyltransferase [Aeromicrobium sp. Leaf350]|uniref:bifunctional adenosylcobinamide kinase/adenosylcobinamide-phosphate guanylyltransferase n=1 Tax=Aeromicrobium sp. Leaf350 TaxID=2876565 RepID=UPI001E4B3263|nr:bifunctional adenosylcobinamide kinase/adenosylcobinamide-phosphate guanylyltransferase [Aeromicrobium sp. Leaf350]
MKVLVTGGVRSGKSFHAESLVVGEPVVTYIAPGPSPEVEDDPDWAARVATHRSRRPQHWHTVESIDLPEALAAAEGAVLVDCLGTWITAQLDELDAWDAVLEEWEPVLRERIAAVARAVAETERPVVVVTNEVGMGVVPEHRSGRLFRDMLGRANQAVAAECDQVLLVIAGRVLTL